jgi:hypothetical protein
MSESTKQSLNEAKNGNKSKPMLATGLCYVVECSAGSYDDCHSWIAGIYLDAFDAEKLKTEITTEIEIQKNIPCPFDENQLEFLTDEQSDTYYKWWDDNNDANEFNSARVIEYPIGKPFR